MDLLHEAEAVDGLVNAVVSIFPGVNLHPTLPALETHTHMLAHRKWVEDQSWHEVKYVQGGGGPNRRRIVAEIKSY